MDLCDPLVGIVSKFSQFRIHHRRQANRNIRLHIVLDFCFESKKPFLVTVYHLNKLSKKITGKIFEKYENFTGYFVILTVKVLIIMTNYH